MVVSFGENNSIVEVFLDGRVKPIVQSKLLPAPRGLDYLTSGTLLVCASDSNRIMSIDETGEIDDYREKELSFEPFAIRADTINSLMYIGGKSNMVFRTRYETLVQQMFVFFNVYMYMKCLIE